MIKSDLNFIRLYQRSLKLIYNSEYNLPLIVRVMFGNFAKIGRAVRGTAANLHTSAAQTFINVNIILSFEIKIWVFFYLLFVFHTMLLLSIYLQLLAIHIGGMKIKASLWSSNLYCYYFIVSLLTVFHMNFQRNQKDRHIDLVPHMSRHFYNQVDKPLQ